MTLLSSVKPSKKRRVGAPDQELAWDPGADIWHRPGFLIRRLHQIGVAIFMDGMGELELTPLQFGALTIIARTPGIEQSALGESLGIDRVNAGDIIKRLIGQGLATRDVGVHDRRFKNVFLTPAGHDLAAAGVKRMGSISERLLGPLTEAESDLFLVLVRKLVEGNNALGRTSLKLPVGNEPARATEAAHSKTTKRAQSGRRAIMTHK